MQELAVAVAVRANNAAGVLIGGNWSHAARRSSAEAPSQPARLRNKRTSSMGAKTRNSKETSICIQTCKLRHQAPVLKEARASLGIQGRADAVAGCRAGPAPEVASNAAPRR